jgi:reductive dehalogenase
MARIAGMRLFSHRRRPVHLGPFPLERLARASAVAGPPTGDQPTEPDPAGDAAVAHAMPEYQTLFARHFDGEIARARAPIPDDPAVRAHNLKAAAYFLDVAQAATCAIPRDAWLPGEHAPHAHALVFLIEFGREPRPGDPAEDWIRGTQVERGDLRAAEVAVVMAGYLRNMGFAARGHVARDTQVDIGRLVVESGLARVEDGVLVNPYLGRRFRAGVVTADYAVAADPPLAPDTLAGRWRSHGPAWWLGAGGTRAGLSWINGGLHRPGRPLHLGPAPMEKIRRVAAPTTLVLDDEIRRQPKRANFFTRALMGDLGEKAKRERTRFATKNPYAFAMTPLIRNMVPMQGGEPSSNRVQLTDARANADAVKALGYYLGADLVGVCEAPPWMWYSHHDDGRPIEPYHRYAVVMLIDQGFETMEGASGDDWISGAQSMRAYMRGATIAGVMAAHLRRLGWPARSQTNADSDILQIPPTLMAGLGELSRIGELVLSPFVGPRFKTVVLTTDLPMEVDRPIDFGLQDFCAKCTKCARECPCMAIPFGPKVMFNGYEMWKPDVEKCAKYRVTNMKGSACGRCMKTCPFNTEGLLAHRLFLWLAMHVPATRAWIARLDDRVANGSINRTKKWWFDLEMVDGITVPPKGVNARELDFEAVKRAKTQALALFPPEVAPPPGAQDPHEPDRAAAIRAYAAAESPAGARARRGRA